MAKSKREIVQLNQAETPAPSADLLVERSVLFADSVVKAARDAQAATRCWSSITLAQYAEESAFGKKIPPDSNNFFGIKQVAGFPWVETHTEEEVNGKKIIIVAKFAKFPDLQTCVNYHAHLLTNPHGPYSAFLRYLSDPVKWVRSFAHTYASNSQYANNIVTLIDQYHLRDFD